MKTPLLLVLVLLLLSACHDKKTEKKLSVMQDKHSLINDWYGKEHFKSPSIDDDDDGLTSMEDLDNSQSSQSTTPAASTKPLKGE